MTLQRSSQGGTGRRTKPKTRGSTESPKEKIAVNAQVYLTQGIVEGRAWSEQDAAHVRSVQLARPSAGRRILARMGNLLAS